ncbi:MAG: ArsA family ATPase [Dehalococcoidales bacterium]|nr:ArsA family ATPase [Dehalococcoidales bacterium]
MSGIGSGHSDRGSIYMFAGKGGVGKTTCAATTALHYASLGKKTLAISTDATPSLAHIFEVSRDRKPTRIRESLYISELGINEVEEMWNRKFGREVYQVFSSIVAIDYNSFVDFMTSMLPGLSDEFLVDYIRELRLGGRYDAIIWDTAPLGQTLALLQTPAMLVEHLRLAPRIYSRLKIGRSSREPVLDILRRWQKLSADNIDFLRDEVRFSMVTIPEALAFEQLEDIFRELDKFGFRVERLIVNNVVKTDDSEFLRARAEQQKRYLGMIYSRYSNIEIIELPMHPCEIKGLDRLKEIENSLFRQGG